ncbi:MAG: DUF2848 domain-containing protein [Betaproteobacteria bacterium]
MGLLLFDADQGTLSVAPQRLVVAGWTGRDRAAIEHHIEELALLGVPRPSAVPLYYRLAPQLLTQAGAIQVIGDRSSGEVEPVLLRIGGQWWLTVGSDHTDRRLETVSVAASKQVCAKPVAGQAWRWDAVEPRADSLLLESWIDEDGAWQPYQSGTLASIRPLRQLIDGVSDVDADLPLVLFCGTLAVRPNAAGVGIRPAPRFAMALSDPQGGRSVRHEYEVTALPVVA